MATFEAIFSARDKMSHPFRTMTRRVKTFDQSVNKSRNELERFGRMHVRPKLSVNDRASKPVQNVYGAIKRLNGMTATATVKLRDAVSPKLDALERRLDTMGTFAIGAAAGVGISGGAAIGAGLSTGKVNARVSALTGMDKGIAGQQIDSIYYQGMAGTSRDEVAQSYVNLSQQTELEGKTLLSAVKTNSQMAQLFQKDASEFDRSFSTMNSTMKTGSKEFADMFTYINKNAGDKADDLLDTMTEYASTFQKLKIPEENLASGLVAGSKAGAWNYDLIADSVREFGIRSYEMTDDQRAALEKVMGKSDAQQYLTGLGSGKVSGMEGLVTLARDLSNIKNETTRQKLATELMGTQFEDLGAPVMAMAKGLGQEAQYGGMFAQQYKQSKDDPATAFVRAQRSGEMMVQQAGNSMLQATAPAMEKFNGWLSSPKGQEAMQNVSEGMADLANLATNTLIPAMQFTAENFGIVSKIALGLAVSLGGLYALQKFKGPAGMVFGAGKKFGRGVGRGAKKLGQGTRDRFNGTTARNKARNNRLANKNSWKYATPQNQKPGTKPKNKPPKSGGGKGGGFGGGMGILPGAGGSGKGMLSGVKGVAKRIPGLNLLFTASEFAGAKSAGGKGAAIGGGIGAVGGAALGALLGPVGAIAGGFLGDFAGRWAGKGIVALGEHMQIGKAVDAVKDFSKDVGKGFQNVKRDAQKWLGGVGASIGGWFGFGSDKAKEELGKIRTYTEAERRAMAEASAAFRAEASKAVDAVIRQFTTLPPGIAAIIDMIKPAADSVFASLSQSFQAWGAKLGIDVQNSFASAKAKADNFAASINTVKNNVTNTVSNMGSGIMGVFTSQADGSHANGISNIPFDGYRAILHKGETVLPEEEANLIRTMASGRGSGTGRSGNKSVTFTGDMHIYQEADENRLMKKIAKLLEDEDGVSGNGTYAL
ncbi:phage tail tape measure protein [Aureibacillus halotolerans]|uniref:Phage-related minor tail protein n=1 Tax=Aureibacillus halotolerans TaxID=1508390 RepID=A0A4R6TVK0_9BACI|nr:phage tail tape measure protein [Aureibacillus halotolerans]TDQ35286.1 phage-related minor tail protein [Aureibacillus halotolerans]